MSSMTRYAVFTVLAAIVGLDSMHLFTSADEGAKTTAKAPSDVDKLRSQVEKDRAEISQLSKKLADLQQKFDARVVAQDKVNEAHKSQIETLKKDLDDSKVLVKEFNYFLVADAGAQGKPAAHNKDLKGTLINIPLNSVGSFDLPEKFGRTVISAVATPISINPGNLVAYEAVWAAPINGNQVRLFAHRKDANYGHWLRVQVVYHP